jgi:hypothetical protein
VEDFTVKFVGKHHAEHLRNALLLTYELTTEWTATVYSGMTLKWDYDKRTCDISMPGYVSNVLSKLHVNTSGKAGAQIPQLPLGDDSSP